MGADFEYQEFEDEGVMLASFKNSSPYSPSYCCSFCGVQFHGDVIAVKIKPDDPFLELTTLDDELQKALIDKIREETVAWVAQVKQERMERLTNEST